MAHSTRLWTPRILAALLALGGTFWGSVLAFCLFRSEGSPDAWLYFGPGYVITLGYFVRAAYTPPLAVRHVFWVFSLFVQGFWSFFPMAYVVPKLVPGSLVSDLILGWWVFVIVGSVWGLMSEKPAADE